MPRCTWIFGSGASIANGLTWVVYDEWKRDILEGRISRDDHIGMIVNELRQEVEAIASPCNPYYRLLDYMAEETIDDGYHYLLTTNWDYLLQREVDAWVDNNHPGVAPAFLGRDTWVYHLNGSVEPGDYQNRSPFMLETDSTDSRQANFFPRTNTLEGNRAFERLLWSNLIVIVGMSFECDVDRGLLGALNIYQDELVIGEAIFVVVNPCQMTLNDTFYKLATHFPQACGIQVNLGLTEWINTGMPQLRERIFRH